MCHEIWQSSELAWEDKVDERPELLEVILYWRARQDEAMRGTELKTKQTTLLEINLHCTLYNTECACPMKIQCLHITRQFRENNKEAPALSVW